MPNWSNLPEGVITLVASKFDGPMSDVIRALRGVCKPWRADISVAVTKATKPERAEAGVQEVLKTTPKLRSLTVTGSEGEASETILADISIARKLVPELKSFVFDLCDLSSCSMPLSECLGTNTRDLNLASCSLDRCSVKNLCDFQHLTSLAVRPMDGLFQNTDEFDIIWDAIFTELPSLQILCIDNFVKSDGVFDITSSMANLPNLTSLSIIHSYINRPEFMRNLPRLEHLDLDSTRFLDPDNRFVYEIPEYITSLNICKHEFDEDMYLVPYDGLARLGLLSSLQIGDDDEVADDVLAVIAGLPSLTRLSISSCCNVVDTGLMSLVRSKLVWLELIHCIYVTQEGVDALRAALPGIEVVVR